MKEISTSVLVCGGAGSGMSSAIFLSRLGIDSYLVEKYPSTSPAPKAHYLNQRTMEIFREIGLSEAIYSRSTPAENMASVGWYTSLAGDGPLDGKTIYTMDAFGGGKLKERYQKSSPVRAANYAQLHLEPLLYDFAIKQEFANLNFGHEMLDFEQTEDGVVAEIQVRETGEKYRVRAKYMLGCDGGRFVGDKLGIRMEGIQRLFDMITVHFGADLSPYIDDDSPMIRWFINPESGGSWGSGVLVALGPEKFDRHSEEWLMHFAFDPESANFIETSVLVEKIIELLRLPQGFPIEVKKTNNWKVQGVLAEKFRQGSVFLVGDSAHRHPPTTGLGLNSAIQDAHNLCWKIARVLKGQAADSLLDSYESERRAVTGRNVKWALFTFQNHLVIDAGIGLIPGAPLEVNREAFEILFSDTIEGETRRARLNEAAWTQRTEFQAQDLEIGFHYNSSAVIPDGTEPPKKSPMGDEHIPTSRPGHRLPHAWLKSGDEQVSSLDLLDGKSFKLITGANKQVWLDAVTKAGLDLDVVSVAESNADFIDQGDWASLAETGDDGALLVRPDSHVGWRTKSASDANPETVSQVMRTILGQ